MNNGTSSQYIDSRVSHFEGGYTTRTILKEGNQFVVYTMTRFDSGNFFALEPVPYPFLESARAFMEAVS